MIQINAHLALDEDEVRETFVRASGPGGQHVNKTSTAVELRFDVRASPSLSPEVKRRLERLAGARLTQDGVLILVSQVNRSQEMNRRDVRERLAGLIRAALVAPKPRRATKPTYSSRLKRLDAKTRRGSVKSLRGRPTGEG